MNKYESSTMVRISKATAKKLYNAGFNIYLAPCKYRPENCVFTSAVGCSIYTGEDGETFEKLCNAFAYYNCDSERGRYIAFYVKTAPKMIHFDFADGSNPYIYRGTVWDCLKELQKWGKNFDIIVATKQGFYHLEEKRA